MAKASRLSLGHNPNTAVHNLKKNIQSAVLGRSSKDFPTVSKFYSDLQILLSKLNSRLESHSFKNEVNLDFRVSSSTDAYLKGFIQQKMRDGEKKFVEEMENIKSTFPVEQTELSAATENLKREILDQLTIELSRSDPQTGRIFIQYYKESLMNTFSTILESYSSLNYSSIKKEAAQSFQTFKSKTPVPSIRGMDQLDDQYLDGIRSYFWEYLTYFESECKDERICSIVELTRPSTDG